MNDLFSAALVELQAVVSRIDPTEIATACASIARAQTIGIYGCGRESLQLKGFAMRLHHLGCKVSVAGEMTGLPVGKGDVLLVSAGPGELSTVTALMQVAKAAGAEILFLTARPQSPSARLADQVLAIPAQTMASDRGSAVTSALPMGSVYEGALFLLFEIMVLRLQEILGVTANDMRARHTNLE